jgi:hypothetical protein
VASTWDLPGNTPPSGESFPVGKNCVLVDAQGDPVVPYQYGVWTLDYTLVGSCFGLKVCCIIGG